MYRQHVQKEVEGEWFVSRMCELPMVNSAVEQLTALYSGVKQHNRLFRFTLDTAEGGMHVVYETARPVLSKFDKPIGTLNSVACQQLDKFEHDYPIITKPTEEVLKETKQLCTSAVEPLVNSVDAVKQYSVNKVTSVKTCATDKVIGMKEYGMHTLSAVSDLGTKQMARVLETPVCRQSVIQLDVMLDVADHYVDTLLPENAVEKPVGDDDAEEKHTTVIVKAANLSSKVRRRMYGRITSQLRSAKLRTRETVERLNFTVDLIEYSRAMMYNTMDKAAYVWTEVNKSEEEVAKSLTDEDAGSHGHADSNFERRAIATARHLRQKTKQLIGLPLVQPVYDVVANSVAGSASSLSAVGRHTVGIIGQYHVFITEQCSLWFGWIITTTPMKTMAPVLGDFVMTDSSESGSLPEPATELLNMPRPVDVSEAQLQSGYSSSESPDDDSQPHED